MSKKEVTPKKVETKAPEFIFGKENYMLMIASIAVIVIGFVLMSGTEDIFDFRKLTLAPIVVLLGFVIGVFAIMRNKKA